MSRLGLCIYMCTRKAVYSMIKVCNSNAPAWCMLPLMWYYYVSSLDKSRATFLGECEDSVKGGQACPCLMHYTFMKSVACQNSRLVGSKVVARHSHSSRKHLRPFLSISWITTGNIYNLRQLDTSYLWTRHTISSECPSCACTAGLRHPLRVWIPVTAVYLRGFVNVRQFFPRGWDKSRKGICPGIVGMS